MFSMAVSAMRRHRFAAVTALVVALLGPAAAAAAAPAAQASVSHSAVASAYGGSSCSHGYDCSGLVMEAFGHGAGIWLPHSTYAMLRSPHLHWIPLSQARRGDLMFYGSGHVELYAHGDLTFGAHDAGTIISWIQFGPWWHPTAYYRVR